MVRTGIFTFLVINCLCSSICSAEFQVNVRTSMDQKDAAIAGDSHSCFVVVWTSYFHTPRSNEILARRFDLAGNPLGNEFQVNTTTEGNQSEPAIAMSADANFVVVWQGPHSAVETDEDIFARRFDANGAPLGDEFTVNTHTLDRQLSPGIGTNNAGRFVVVWESENILELGKRAICGRVYDGSGVSIVDEFVVNEEAATCRYPDVAMESDGQFYVVWLKDSSLNSIWKRHFEADGTAPYFSTKVNEAFNFTSLTEPSVAMDATGAFAVVWDGHPDTYLQDDIYLRRYHWSGAPLHLEVRVNTYKSGIQRNPSVAMSDDGQFVVLWQSETAVENRMIDIFGQRFGAQGEHIGDPITLGEQFRLNTYIFEDQRRPVVAMDNYGNFVAAWESYDQDGADYGVFGETGPKTGSADINGDGFVDFGDYCALAVQWQENSPTAGADLIDDDEINGQDLAAFCQQWLTPVYQCSQADYNNDGKINMKDYAVWAGNCSETGPNIDGDADGSGIVDMADLRPLVFNWTKTCQ